MKANRHLEICKNFAAMAQMKFFYEAIIYIRIEIGMRRTAINSLNLVDIDFARRIISTVEKGGSVQPYPIS